MHRPSSPCRAHSSVPGCSREKLKRPIADSYIQHHLHWKFPHAGPATTTRSPPLLPLGPNCVPRSPHTQDSSHCPHVPPSRFPDIGVRPEGKAQAQDASRAALSLPQQPLASPAAPLGSDRHTSQETPLSPRRPQCPPLSHTTHLSTTAPGAEACV